MFTSTAVVQYRNDPDGPWVTAWIDQNILDYYFTFIPKYYKVIKPRWKAHATVIRPEDKPVVEKVWGKHNGERIEFIYNSELLVERGIWWFNLWSKVMEEIRLEMGCSIVSRITKPPWPGYNKCFHCTIATEF